MEQPEIDRVELLRGLSAEERARTLIEWGLEGDPDPEIEAMSKLVVGSDSEYCQRLAAGRKRSRRQTRSRQLYEQDLRYKRIYGKPPRRIDPGELPDPEIFDLKAEASKKAPRPYANDPFVSKEQAAANTGNPFTDVRPTRLAQLRLDEVARVYDAMAFARQAYGRRMNSHLTIRWSAIGVGEGDASEVLAELLNRAGKWIARTKAEPIWVWSEQVALPDELLWVYVHEKAPTYGFHTHVLLSLDVRLCQAFREWVFECLAQLLHRKEVPGTTAVLRRSYAKSTDDQDGLHWFWFKYVIKQLDPKTLVASPFCDKIVPARELFEPRRLRMVLPVAVARLVGVCRCLDVGAQRRAQFVSHWRQGFELYSDWAYPMRRLREDRSIFGFETPDEHIDIYPNLRLGFMMYGDEVFDWSDSSRNCEAIVSSAPQYIAFQAAWDRLTVAQKDYEAAVGRRQKTAARRVLDEAETLFYWSETVINLDRWGQMPDVVYKGAGSPRPPLRRSYAEWQRQLADSALYAAAALEWRRAMPSIEKLDLVPREDMNRPRRRPKTPLDRARGQ